MYKDYSLDDVKKSAEQKLFTVVSTFSGGGGSSTGYKMAGGDVKCVVEFQKIGIQTYLANYPNTKFFCKDIRKVTGEQILKRIKMESDDLDIFDGSPPCPPFSMSGSKRDGWNKTKKVYGFQQSNIEDLSFDVARLVGEIKPKVFICENVKGMTMDYAHDHFQTIMDAFVEHKYEVGWRVLNSKNYGVPQGRERVFIVGIRDDVYKTVTGNDLSPRYGKTNLFDEAKLGIDNTTLEGIWPEKNEIIPTLRDTILDLKEDEENIKEHEEIMEQVKKRKNWKYLSKMKTDVEIEIDDSGREKGGYVALGETVREEQIKEWHELKKTDPFIKPLFCWKNKETGELVYKMPKENRKEWKNLSFAKDSGFQVRRVSWDRPSHTLTERGLQVGTTAHLHPGEHRGFTSIEAKKIMSLPSDFILTGNLNERLARIGLMVAPRQMEHLSRSIYEKVLLPYKEASNAKSI